MHLILDGYATKNLSNSAVVKGFIHSIVDSIGMEIIDKPHIYELTNGSGEPGITALTGIKQSSITIHTFPNEPKGYIYIDIFSCRDFDKVTIVSLAREYFNIMPTWELIIPRGQEHRLVGHT